ncbi:MAG: CDP-diacylglycerol diphosphatase [Burkholderiales bacterium]
MRFFSLRHKLWVVPCILFLLNSFVQTSAGAAESRDALWKIVSTCIDVHAANYCNNCPFPSADSPCGRGGGCEETTEVWEETSEYVAIRDRKMCGCKEGFVHGLAIPRRRIIGVEDPKRPDGIWSFAWAAARKRISNEVEIALAINPLGMRSQDQFHVHIVRLRPDARRSFDDSRLTCVSSFADIWRAAAKRAELLGLKDYGVLVAKQADGNFLVLIEGKSPEQRYTQWKCH